MEIDCIGKPEGCKLIRIHADIDGSLITRISIHGDFFAVPEEAFERLEAKLAPCTLDALEQRFNMLVQQEAVELIGISANAIMQLISDALEGRIDETCV